MFEATKPFCTLIEENIKSLKDLTARYDVLDIANVAINNNKFQKCSGSASLEHHHYGTGGLIQHTKEVVYLCINTALLYSETFKDPIEIKKLVLAAIFHDVGKIEDYTVTYGCTEESDIWSSTLHKKKIHHITRSVLIWQDAANRFENRYEWLNKEFTDDVLHAILSHHGLREWGSPVRPHSNVAWVLHLCDGISARLNDWWKK